MNALPVMPDPSAPTPLPVDGWSRFVAARTSAEFCDAWLTVLRDKFPLIAQAAILVESTDGEREWTTVGVHGNIVEASWLALCDALVHKSMRSS